MGAKPFADKRVIMERSGVLLTRHIADEEAWDEAVLERRAEESFIPGRPGAKPLVLVRS